MSPAVYTLVAVVGIVCTLGGLVIGYYKSKADFMEKLSNYITVEDCKNCTMKTEVSNIIKNMKTVSEELRQSCLALVNVLTGKFSVPSFKSLPELLM